MLQWSQLCNETKLSLASRIPVSQSKRNRSFRMNEKKVQKSTNCDFSARNICETDCTFEIVHSQKGNISTKYRLEPQRNIEADVFDWLSKNSEPLDKYSGYCLENNTNVCNSTEDLRHITNVETAFKTNEKSFRIDLERDREMAKDKMGTKSYFNAFRNAFFPFEGKYFYLSGERNNQKVSLTETTKTVGDMSGHLIDKTNCEEDKYKEILGDEKGENETKMRNKKWEINGLKDTKVYNEDRRANTEDKNGYLRYQHECSKDNASFKINLKSESSSDAQQKEISRLRMQIEKLSAFVDSSDERREQSEKLLAQQKEELLKHIREKELLDNRVCCLEELRRNLQRKCDEITDDNKSLKLVLKSNQEKLTEEKERVRVLKKECSNEIAKNAELELVLQTIREELGCPSAANNKKSSRDDSKRDWGEKLDETDRHAQRVEKKVRWGDVQTQEITKPTQSLPFNAEQQLWGPSTRIPQPEPERPQYSCLKQNSSEEGSWRREKKQFEGKIMLLEMDKKKLRAQIELLEAKIVKQENTEQNLRENNEVLEFRILEMEYEIVEKAKKK